MKIARLTVVLGASLAFIPACKKKDEAAKQAEQKPPDKKPPEVKTPPVASGPEALIARYKECFGFVMNPATADQHAGCYTDDAVGLIAGMPPFKGGKEITEKLFGGFFSGFSDVKLEPQFMFVNGHNLAVVNWFRGVNSASMMGAPATNKPMSFLGMRSMTWTEDNQKQSWDLHVADLAGGMAQLGLSPAPHRPVTDAAPGQLVTVIATDSQTERDNVALIQKGCDLFNKHDVAGFSALLADDVVLADQTAPADVKGRAGAEGVFKEIFTAFPDITGTCSAWGAGDYVVNQVDWTGTNTGDGFGMKKTGKAVKIHDSEIYKVKDGKVAEYWRFSNGADLAMQLGLIPPPGSPPPATK